MRMTRKVLSCGGVPHLRHGLRCAEPSLARPPGAATPAAPSRSPCEAAGRIDRTSWAAGSSRPSPPRSSSMASPSARSSPTRAGGFEIDRRRARRGVPGTVTVTAACDGTGDNVSSTELTIPGATAPDLTLSNDGCRAPRGVRGHGDERAAGRHRRLRALLGRDTGGLGHRRCRRHRQPHDLLPRRRHPRHPPDPSDRRRPPRQPRRPHRPHRGGRRRRRRHTADRQRRGAAGDRRRPCRPRRRRVRARRQASTRNGSQA